MKYLLPIVATLIVFASCKKKDAIVPLTTANTWTINGESFTASVFYRNFNGHNFVVQDTITGQYLEFHFYGLIPTEDGDYAATHIINLENSVIVFTHGSFTYGSIQEYHSIVYARMVNSKLNIIMNDALVQAQSAAVQDPGRLSCNIVEP